MYRVKVLFCYLFPHINTSNFLIVFIEIYLKSRMNSNNSRSNKRIWQEPWKSRRSKFKTYIPLMLCLWFALCRCICILRSNCTCQSDHVADLGLIKILYHYFSSDFPWIFCISDQLTFFSSNFTLLVSGHTINDLPCPFLLTFCPQLALRTLTI